MGDSTILYVVKPGDWLAKIAKEHGSTVSAIWEHPFNEGIVAKNGSPDRIFAGDVLHIPVRDAPTPPGERRPLEPPPGGSPPASPGDWPYGPLPPELARKFPTWACPDNTCKCHPDAEVELLRHTVFFHDALARRMANARCRVHLHGRLLAAPTHALADGSLSFEAPLGTQVVALEWAPQGTPQAPQLPFRRLYRLDMFQGAGDAASQRLHHLGYESPPRVASHVHSLRRRVALFQADYGLEVNGRVDTVFDRLKQFHDEARLPAIAPSRRADPPGPPPPAPVSPGPRDLRPPAQGVVAVLQPRFPRGALTVSSASTLTAKLLIVLVQSERRLPKWFRSCLELGSEFRIEAHVALESDVARARENDELRKRKAINDEQIEVLDAAVRAIQSDKWQISTGAVRNILPGLFPPWRLATGIHPDDPIVTSIGPVDSPELDGVGVTMPPTSISTPKGRSDYHIDDANARREPGRRELGRGLVWLSETLEAKDPRTGVMAREDQTPRDVAEQFVHELACHADLINDGRHEDAVHSDDRPTEATRREAVVQSLLPPSGRGVGRLREKLGLPSEEVPPELQGL